RQDDHRRKPKRVDDGPDDDDREPGGPTGLGEHYESDGGEDQAGSHQVRRADLARDHRDHHRTGDEPEHRGHRRKPCLQWREPEHQLEILRDEDVRSERNESPALNRSSRPAWGSRNSGSSTGPSTRSSSITGTPSRNTEPHQKYCRRTPPSSGPIAPPTE